MADIFTIIDNSRFDDVIQNSGLKLSRDKRDIIDKWLSSYVPAGTPHIVHTLGFVGSGKTTVKKQFLNGNENYVPMGFDAVMESFPEYQNDYQNFGAQEAFARWELPARALGYEILNEAIKRKLNVMFEHSGARRDHASLLVKLKEHGWRVTILETQCDVETALQRARARPDARWFPDSYVFERKAAVDALKSEYRKVADEWLSFDTSGEVPQLVN